MRPYWNPEQPPPCTNTRRPLPAFPSSTSRSLIFDAAVGDTLIIWKLYAPATAPAKAFRLKPVRYSFGNQHLTGELIRLLTRRSRLTAGPTAVQRPYGGCRRVRPS